MDVQLQVYDEQQQPRTTTATIGATPTAATHEQQAGRHLPYRLPPLGRLGSSRQVRRNTLMTAPPPLFPVPAAPSNLFNPRSLSASADGLQGRRSWTGSYSRRSLSQLSSATTTGSTTAMTFRKRPPPPPPPTASLYAGAPLLEDWNALVRQRRMQAFQHDKSRGSSLPTAQSVPNMQNHGIERSAGWRSGHCGSSSSLPPSMYRRPSDTGSARISALPMVGDNCSGESSVNDCATSPAAFPSSRISMQSISAVPFSQPVPTTITTVQPPQQHASGGWKGGYARWEPNQQLPPQQNLTCTPSDLVRRRTQLQKVHRASLVAAAKSGEQEECQDAEEGRVAFKPRRSDPFVSAQEQEECDPLLQQQPAPSTIVDNDGEQVEKDLASILDGSWQLPFLHEQGYRVEGCITVSPFGFVLLVSRAKNAVKQKLDTVKRNRDERKNAAQEKELGKRKQFYVKMVSRHSQAYQFIGKHVNPQHTELALLQSKKAKHLPQYVEHYWTDNYLAIITKTHGIMKESKLIRWNPFRDAYHEVHWIYYFQTCA